MRYFIFVIVFLTGCHQHPENAQVKQDSQAETITNLKDTIVENQVPSPTLMEMSGFDWNVFRNNHETLLNTGAVIPGTWRDTVDGLHYARTLFNFDLRQQTDTTLAAEAPLAEFITWMPGNEILKWNELDKEELVSVRCKHALPALVNFDLVGKDTSLLALRFGKPDTLLPDGMAFVRDSELLRVFTDKNKVTSFYWMRLDVAPVNVHDIPEKTLNFNRWKEPR